MHPRRSLAWLRAAQLRATPGALLLLSPLMVAHGIWYLGQGAEPAHGPPLLPPQARTDAMKTVAAALALLSLLAGAAAQNATAATVGAAAGGDEYVTVADPNTDPILRAACIQAFDGQCAECDLEMDPPTCMACVDPHAVWSPSQFKVRRRRLRGG